MLYPIEVHVGRVRGLATDGRGLMRRDGDGESTDRSEGTSVTADTFL